MELRHLRYFVAVAEELNFTSAAESRLHVAQPSLSRQIRDLETELGVTLLVRGARGVDLTPSGRALLDHARLVLLQVDIATEAAQRAAVPQKTSFALGFLTGYEIEWLAPVMRILGDELPRLEVSIHSNTSPELATALVRGKLDIAFLRRERNMPLLAYEVLRSEPLIVVMPLKHEFAETKAVDPRAVAAQTIIGVPSTSAPVLRAVTDAYALRKGIDLTPKHEVDNLSMAFSMTASTAGVALLPFSSRNLLPPTLVWRPLIDPPPTIDFVVGFKASNPSPLLKLIIARLGNVRLSQNQRSEGRDGAPLSTVSCT